MMRSRVEYLRSELSLISGKIFYSQDAKQMADRARDAMKRREGEVISEEDLPRVEAMEEALRQIGYSIYHTQDAKQMADRAREAIEADDALSSSHVSPGP